MKNVLTSLTAIMLVVWYSLSVIGFDVHTCSDSGQTYIATVASGFSCADIHPETHPVAGHSADTDHHPDTDRHSCHAGSEPRVHTGCKCCQKHENVSEAVTEQLDTKPCCSDDFQVIVLTGVRSSQDQDDCSDRVPVRIICGQSCSTYTSNAFVSSLRTFYKPSSGDIVPRDVMVSYNIWRI